MHNLDCHVTYFRLKFSNWNVICFEQKESINALFFRFFRQFTQFLMLFLKLQGQGLFKFCITIQYHERWLLCILLVQTSYTLDKNSPKWLCESSPNSSRQIWNQVSFPLNFASLFNLMRDKSSVFFQLKLNMIFTKGAHPSAKF